MRLTAILTLLLALALLAPTTAHGAARDMLTGPLTLYVRDSDGNDAGACTVDAPGLACKTWQAAVNKLAARDLGGHIGTVQHGSEGPRTFSAPTLVPPIWGYGPGGIVIRGQSTPGYTNFNVSGANPWTLWNTGAVVTFEHMTIRAVGNMGLIEVTYGSKGAIGQGVTLGSSSFAQIFMHDPPATMVIVSTTLTLVDGAPYFVYANGGRVWLENATVAFSGVPNYYAFISVTMNASFQLLGTTYTGTCNGYDYAVGTNGVLNFFGAGLSSIPCSMPGFAMDGGIVI